MAGRRKKPHEGGHENAERWLLTYADLITLLMVFFVILYSFSIIDVKKFEDLKGSLDKAFSAGVLSGLNTTSLNAQVAYGQVQQQIKSQNETAKASVASQLQHVADATGSGEGITVTEVTQGVNVSLASQLLFQSGTANLKPGATAEISIDAGEIPNAVVVPVAALLSSDEGGDKVMVAGADSLAHEHAVKVGVRSGDEVQILSGVNPGEQVIIQGGLGLDDKAKIQVTKPGAENKDEDEKK